MYFNLLFNFKSKIILIIFSILLFFLIVLSLLVYNKLDIKINGKNYEFNINSLDVNKYTTTYDMTVVSNKNIHTYSVSESYSNLENLSIIKFLDYSKNEVVLKLKDNTCTIINSGNMLGLTAQLTNNNKNLTSFSTFMYIYNHIDGRCLCKKKEYIKEENISVIINICNEENCILKDSVGLSNISKIELTLNKGIPKTYIIYDKNNKEYISILYNTFKFNVFQE